MQGSRLFVSLMVKRMRLAFTGAKRSMFSRAFTAGRSAPDFASGAKRASCFSTSARRALNWAASLRAASASGVRSSRSAYSTPATNACIA